YYDTLHEGGATAAPPLADPRSGPLFPAVDGDVRATPFAGRAREIEHLIGRGEAATRGEPAAIAIVGEPGVGKSRLAAEALARASAGRLGLVAYGRCRQL